MSRYPRTGDQTFVQADGRTIYEFRGRIKAKGIDMVAGTSASVPSDRKIRFTDPASTAQAPPAISEINAYRLAGAPVPTLYVELISQMLSATDAAYWQCGVKDQLARFKSYIQSHWNGTDSTGSIDLTVGLQTKKLLDHTGASDFALKAQESWHMVGGAGEPAFQNGWMNYGGQSDAAFFKDSSGIVHLTGTVKSGTAITAFILPPGYRPASPKILRWPVVNNSAFGIAEVNSGISATAGGVLIYGGNVWVDLSSISFRAEV